MTDHITASALRRQAFFWLATAGVLVLFIFVFRSVLLPFFAGFALAYFLDPVADYLERKGFSRTWATVTILILFLMVFVLAIAIVVPILITQTADFAARVPGYFNQLQDLLSSASLRTEWLTTYLGIDPEQLKTGFADILKQGFGFMTGVVQGIVTSGAAAINVVSLLVVAPVVAFYMLLDWDNMVARIDSWVPRQHVTSVRAIAADMDAAVAGFIRGQGTVSLILGLFYAIALTIAGLNFGLLIGLLTGVLSFVPYVGSAIGFILAIGVALVQFWPDYVMIIIIAVIFFTGQFLEGNFLQPKLVGDSVGLHPVWLMFALFAFGSLFGFTGMLIAVPAAASVAVLVRFALNSYLDSDLYEQEKPVKKAAPKKADGK